MKRGQHTNPLEKMLNSENSITEFFCYLLSYQQFREAFLGLFLSRKELELINYEDIETQYLLPGYRSIPDIAIRNDCVDILIENKIGNASLTNNQPASYIEYLEKQNKKIKKFVFISPKKYYMRDELENRIKAKCRQSKIACVQIHWEDIAKIIKIKRLNKTTDYFKDFAAYLSDKYKMFEIYFNNVEVKRMYDKEIPGILDKLFKIIDGIKMHYESEYSTRLIPRTNEEYALYFKDKNGKEVLYVGVWYEFWKKHDIPICFGIERKKHSDNLVNKFVNSCGRKYVKEQDGWLMSWIDKRDMQRKNYSQILLKTIDEKLKLLMKL